MRAESSPAPRNLRGDLALAALALGLWLARLRLAEGAAGTGVDASWQQALGRAWSEGLRFGGTLLFPYGPPAAWPYAPGRAAWLLELALCGAIVLALALHARRLRSRLAGAFLLALLVVLPGGLDAWLLAAVVVPALAAAGARPSVGALVGLGLLFGALAPWKLVQLVAAAWAVLVLVVGFLARREPRRALALGLAAAAGFAGTWLACGQRLADLPRFVRGGLEISAHHSEAMSLPGPPAIEALGLACVAAALLVLALGLRGPRAPERALVLLVGLFLAWKTGFTRQEGERALALFGFAALVPVLALAREREPEEARAASGPSRPSRLALAAGGATLALALAGTLASARADRLTPAAIGWAPLRVAPNLRALLRPAAAEQARARERAELARDVLLPRVRAAVGDASIDLVGSRQALLFAEGLRWTPRPVFQSYLAYSPRLLAENARFLAGEGAPRFVLWSNDAIDGRVPAGAEAPSLAVLCAGYEPVLAEQGLVLWERRSTAAIALPEPRVLEHGSLALGTTQSLASAPGASVRRLVLDLEPSTLGRLARALHRIPPLWIVLEREGGERSRWRLVPGIARAGLLVDPLLLRTGEWSRLLRGERLAPLRSFRVEGDPGAERCFPARIGWRLEELPGLEPPRSLREPEPDAFALFRTRPRSVQAAEPPERAVVAGEEVVLLRAPCRLVLALPATGAKLSVRLALHPSAVAARLGDGLEARLLARSLDGRERAIASRAFDARAADAAEERHLALELAPGGATELVLELDPGPAGDALADVLLLRELELSAR